MIKLFGVTGTCILVAIAIVVGIVGVVVWVWFGREDDDCEEWDEGWYDWLKEQDEMKEQEDGDR